MQLAIFGPGLIGGSLALAARRRLPGVRIAVWSRDPAERETAHALVLADLISGDVAGAAADCDLAVLCTPPAAMPALARSIVPHLREDAVVSDVASVKGDIGRALEGIFGGRYVGSHPMAGSEVAGLVGARAELFDGTVCLLTPAPGASPAALETLEHFWRSLGARLHTLSPDAHDETVALVSHLPHVMAASLVAFVSAQAGDPLDCAGPGWRDTTRVAAGPAELWTEILSHNRAAVTRALHGVIAKLREAVECLEEGRETDLQRFLTEASLQRRRERD